jgi:Tat protein secretion system quality control protein TatD with DNase activity
MFYRRKKVINFKEPKHFDNPLITFAWDRILIETDQGTLVVESKPRKRRKKEEDSED